MNFILTFDCHMKWIPSHHRWIHLPSNCTQTRSELLPCSSQWGSNISLYLTFLLKKTQNYRILADIQHQVSRLRSDTLSHTIQF